MFKFLKIKEHGQEQDCEKERQIDRLENRVLGKVGLPEKRRQRTKQSFS